YKIIGMWNIGMLELDPVRVFESNNFPNFHSSIIP
ncbi:unnamed protein product, partial [marine sediment metagenome]